MLESSSKQPIMRSMSMGVKSGGFSKVSGGNSHTPSYQRSDFKKRLSMKRLTESLTNCFSFRTSGKTRSHKVNDNTAKKLDF